MKNWKLLFLILLSILFINTACNNETSDLPKEPKKDERVSNKKESVNKYTSLAETKSNEIEHKPIQLTTFADVVDASLTKPLYDDFEVEKEFTISGTVKKYDLLKGKYAWIKLKHLDKDETFEYYSPVKDGRFSQSIHFFNGNGKYSVQVLLPSTDQENYYSELAAFEVMNTDTNMIRDISYTPYGLDAGLHINEPNTGLVEENEMIHVSGKVAESSVMLQIEKEEDSWQHIIPVSNGSFSFELPLYFGEGVYNVHVLLPDKKLENRYQYGSTFKVHNTSSKNMKPIEYHRGYEEKGINLEAPIYGGYEVDLMLPIKGTIDSRTMNVDQLTHLYIKTKKGSDEALDVVPIHHFHFDESIYLRFGPGEYEITINVPEINPTNKSYFSFSSIAALKVINIAKEDNRDLLPSRGIQSDAPEIIALSHEITKNAKSDKEKAKAVYEYVAKNISYDVEKYKNSEFEWDDNALKTLSTKKGVCQDYVYLAVALLRANNIEARFIAGQAGTGVSKENHAWVETKVDGKWLIMDPTWGSGYLESDRFVAKYTEKYFDPDKAEFTKTHIREKEEY
ncbi:transglutaminase domain-containing protein [Bacillus sp. FJAT-49732]|uniref:Transglutaminase domain-containing protein n=1 Tax=Lederbergia citrisecunda TaxID=2833583 RepID=A0A942TMB4_9BACI|nr:transglutaminase-like domain-containing protein [Lederbergia citrisecunda]MBS4199366.1 transglutaminase domain-containing protein [Lederbergia citrisecunda]